MTKRKGETDISLWAWILAGVFAVACVVFILLWASARGNLQDVEALHKN